MKVYITTLGRSNNQITLKCLNEGKFSWPVTLVVQDHEYDLHRKLFPDTEVLSLPLLIKTLGPTRRYLIGKARAKKEKVILLDDDLLFYWRPDPNDWHLRYPPPGVIDKIFEEVDEMLDSYAHVSVSPREGNNRIPDYWVQNIRYMRFLGYNTALFPRDVESGRVCGMSDFDLALQLLRRGCRSNVCFRYAQDQKGGTQAPGGCSLNRTHDTHNAEIDRMLEWHKGFVKEREKKNKTGGAFGTRRELTIYWQKAFESSKQNTPG